MIYERDKLSSRLENPNTFEKEFDIRERISKVEEEISEFNVINQEIKGINQLLSCTIAKICEKSEQQGTDYSSSKDIIKFKTKKLSHVRRKIQKSVDARSSFIDMFTSYREKITDLQD